jgi:mono/diheme cytochrome c family protein
MLKTQSALALAATLFIVTACQPSLEHQPKLHSLEDPRSFVIGTIPYLKEEAAPPVDRRLVMHGKERYEIYCAVCHGMTGSGDGIATQRGLAAPLSFTAYSVGKQSLSELEQVIAKGKGRMLAFSNRVPFQDRYAISAYVQILALRAQFPVARLSSRQREEMRNQLMKNGTR